MCQGNSIVSIYEFDDAVFQSGIKILEFSEYNDEWLEFVLNCRRGINHENIYDIVTGGVANDKVFDTVELFFGGLIDKAEALKRLRYEQINMQYCFRNQSVINKYLKFINSEEV